MGMWGEERCEAILFHILNELWKLPKPRMAELPSFIFCSCCMVSPAEQEVQASQVCSIRPLGSYPSDFPGQLWKGIAFLTHNEWEWRTRNIQKGPCEVFWNFQAPEERVCTILNIGCFHRDHPRAVTGLFWAYTDEGNSLCLDQQQMSALQPVGGKCFITEGYFSLC